MADPIWQSSTWFFLANFDNLSRIRLGMGVKTAILDPLFFKYPILLHRKEIPGYRLYRTFVQFSEASLPFFSQKFNHPSIFNFQRVRYYCIFAAAKSIPIAAFACHFRIQLLKPQFTWYYCTLSSRLRKSARPGIFRATYYTVMIFEKLYLHPGFSRNFELLVYRTEVGRFFFFNSWEWRVNLTALNFKVTTNGKKFLKYLVVILS